MRGRAKYWESTAEQEKIWEVYEANYKNRKQKELEEKAE